MRMSSTLGSPFKPCMASAQMRLQRPGALEKLLVAIDILRGERRRAGEGMARIGVAVEQLDHVLGPLHEGVVDALRTITPPIGTVPEFTPLAKVIMSGTTP